MDDDYPPSRPHHHHHHRRDDDDEEERRPQYGYPPPPSDDPYGRPPPPNMGYPPPDEYQMPPPRRQHGHYEEEPPPPPAHDSGAYGYSRPGAAYGHEEKKEEEEYGRPPPPSHSHVSHHQSAAYEEHQGPVLPKGEEVRVFCEAGFNFSLAVRDGELCLAHANPSDPAQHWIKDEKYSTRVKDEEGCPSFSLVNQATGLAIQHPTGATQPVRLVKYNGNEMESSTLWTASKDLGDGWRAIRLVNNITLNLDAFNGDQDHGGVKDGTTLVVWEWTKASNQKWKIMAY